MGRGGSTSVTTMTTTATLLKTVTLAAKSRAAKTERKEIIVAELQNASVEDAWSTWLNDERGCVGAGLALFILHFQSEEIATRNQVDKTQHWRDLRMVQNVLQASVLFSCSHQKYLKIQKW